MAGLSEAERGGLVSAGTPISLSRGDVLLRQGEAGGTLFILVFGYVKVTMAVTGPEVILAIRGRGDLVGEFTVIDDKPRTATVTALGLLRAIRISRVRFQQFCAQHPDANPKIMQSLTDKIRRASDRRAASRTVDSQVRLAKVLYEIAEEFGEPQQDGLVTMPPLTQADWAALASIAPSTVERAMKELRSAGIVLSRYRRTAVIDMDALRAAASDREEGY
jgi:CRP/FNR family cyclic AMP-dependent transcriptional regulator